VSLAFEKGHLKGVEENGGEDQCREWVQEGITLPGFYDPVGFKGGSKNNNKNQNAKKQRSGEVTRKHGEGRERKDGKEKNAQGALQDRRRFLLEGVEEDPPPAPPESVKRIVHPRAIDLHSESAHSQGSHLLGLFH